MNDVTFVLELRVALICSIIIHGGDPVSTWVAKPEGHVEDVANLVKNVTKHIVAKTRNFANVAANQGTFPEVAMAA